MAPYLNYFNFLQTISILYGLVSVTCTGSSLISHDEECFALFQFKQSLILQDNVGCNDRRFQKLDSWKPTTNASSTSFDCCSWNGVICSNDDEDSHVIGLDLSESFLCGHINSSSTLFDLVHLQSLDLSINDFHGSQIPSEVGRLMQLRSLNLFHSGFSGQIPNEISHLMQLSFLDLSGNNTLKLQSPSFEKLVQNLTGLEELYLSGVDISASVPQLLAKFSSLRSLMLANCLLRNEFPAAIFKLPKLKILDVSSNADLTGSFPEFRNTSLLEHLNLASTGFFGIVSESISNLNKLKVLDLNDCSLSDHIPGSISNLTQLTFLGLAGNKFTSPVPSLGSLLKLEFLEVDGNRFKDGRLPHWLGKLTELTELSAANMNMNGEIPPFFGNLTKLSVIQMGMNSLSGHIPSSFFNLTQLRFLDLEQNQFHGPISSSFSNFKSLQSLGLHMNNFSGKLDLGIFLGLNKLVKLLLGNNRLSVVATNNYTNSTLPELQVLGLESCNLKEFPTFLHMQKKIVFLFLPHNKIGGLVPGWILHNFQETLQVFDLSNNFITGFDQHPHFLPWARLESLDVSSNQLQGEIPPLICELKSLRGLALSSNNLSGTLPPCFTSLINSLSVLYLSRNNFHGKMMNTFTHGSRLRIIDLSENGFVGQLPRSLKNCTNLEVLSLGDNSFVDVFPFWLGTLTKLQVLVLRANKFYGPIQGSTTVFSHFPKLQIIDLSNNAFSGQLHQKYFQSWNAMKSAYIGESSYMEIETSSKLFSTTWAYSMTIIHKGVRTEYSHILNIFMAIDLSCNHFEGEIPHSLQDLRGLESLNLSNNHFSGPVLPSLGYLKNLEVLDLSQNELSGEIPQQLVQLSFLAIFNVSFNHLDGRIPEGKQFNTFENNSYKGNPQLCGQPLLKECGDSKGWTRVPPDSNIHESLLPRERIDWIFIFCGVGSGMVIGIVIGNFLHTRYSCDCFTKGKYRWVRPLSNTKGEAAFFNI